MTTLIKFMQKKIHISTKTVLQTTSYLTQAQKSKTWIYLLVAIIIILGFGIEVYLIRLVNPSITTFISSCMNFQINLTKTSIP